MAKSAKNIWLAGVDGCRNGWMVTFMRPNGKVARQRFLDKFSDIFRQPERPKIVVVDMPIGLPKKSPVQGRAAERIARLHLKGRRSSVFRVPSRRAVHMSAGRKNWASDAECYKEACLLARKTSVDGKAFAKQGFYICDKIAEVDKCLRANSQARQRTFESHPELAFWRLNNKRPLEHAKKHPQGIEKRKKLLRGAGISPELISAKPPKGAKADDAIDSLVCVVVARLIKANRATSFPSPAPRDQFGLPMAIWA